MVCVHTICRPLTLTIVVIASTCQEWNCATLLSFKSGGMEIDDDMEEGKDEKGGADELLRDFQYALKCQFMERNRNLKVSWLSPNILS